MMRYFNIALVGLVLLINLFVIQPAFADRPNLDENIDYLQVTETLDGLLNAREKQKLPEGITSPEALQQKITELQYQKYIMETGQGCGECMNQTNRTIAVYGAKSKKSDSSYDNTLYLLAPGEATDDDWDCNGVYIPNNVNVAGLELGGASAIKILDGTQLVVTENPDTGAIQFNLPPAQVLQPGDANWDIPDLAEAAISRQLPQAPTD